MLHRKNATLVEAGKEITDADLHLLEQEQKARRAARPDGHGEDLDAGRTPEDREERSSAGFEGVPGKEKERQDRTRA
jgi:hypothetical protein